MKRSISRFLVPIALAALPRAARPARTSFADNLAFIGPEPELDAIARKVFGVSLEQIRAALPERR